MADWKRLVEESRHMSPVSVSSITKPFSYRAERERHTQREREREREREGGEGFIKRLGESHGRGGSHAAPADRRGRMIPLGGVQPSGSM